MSTQAWVMAIIVIGATALFVNERMRFAELQP